MSGQFAHGAFPSPSGRGAGVRGPLSRLFSFPCNGRPPSPNGGREKEGLL